MVQVFMDGDFVIPPWESIEIIILQSGDLVRVVRTQKKGKKKKDQEKPVPKVIKRKQETSKSEREKSDETKSKPRKTGNVQDTSSSGSDSDTSEDITSKVASGTLSKVDQVKVPNKPSEQKKIDSTSSDSSDSSSDETEIDLKKKSKLSDEGFQKSSPNHLHVNLPQVPCLDTVTKEVTKKMSKTSSSDTDISSDSSGKENDKIKSAPNAFPEKLVNKNACSSQSPIIYEQPKRKRKR